MHIIEHTFEHDDEADADRRDVLAGVQPDPAGTPSQRIAWVLTQRPSAATLAVLEGLVDEPLPRQWRLLEAKCWDRQQAAVTAFASAANVAAASVAAAAGVHADAAESELAMMLRRSDAALRWELGNDRRLAELPRLFAVLAAGDCTARHVGKFLEITETLDLDTTIKVDTEVGDRAATMTVTAFGRIVRKTVARLDNRSPAEKQQAGRPKLGVRCYPRSDGLISIAATLPAADGIAAMVAINRRADALRLPGDTRTHGERQLDALLGLRDDPAELVGYGPIDPAAVRALLAEPGSTLRRLVTDPVTGVFVDYGTTRYRPDAHLTGLLAARDVTCRYPGCTTNARYCDDEHAVPYPDGDTSAANLTEVCTTHHLRKTFDGFTYDRPDPATGETLWTTPAGFTYQQTPTTYTDGTPDPGNTHWLNELHHAETEQRLIPQLPEPDPPDDPPPQHNHVDPPF